MRLILLFTLLSILIFINPSKAQERIPRYSVTLGPAILDPGTVVALQPGIQFYINRSISLLSEVAIPVVSDPGAAVMKGFRISSELKYQFCQTKQTNPYLSFQLAYTNRNWKEGPDYYIPEYTDYIYRFEKAELSSPVYGGAIKLGKEFTLNKRWYIDVFFGLGVRHTRTRYHVVHLKPTPDLIYNMDTRLPAWRYDYPKTRLQGIIGFRMGRRFL